MSMGNEKYHTTNENTNAATTNIVSPRHLDLEEAETSNLAQLESQIHNGNEDENDGSPPLARLSIFDRQLEQVHHLLSSNDEDNDNNSNNNNDNHVQLQLQLQAQAAAATTTATTRRRSSMSAVLPSFKHVARRIVLMQRVHHQKSTKQVVVGGSSLTNTSGHTSSHTHTHTHTHTHAPSNSSPLRRGRHRKNTKSTAADLLDQLTLPGLISPTTTGSSGKSKRHSMTGFHERNQSEDSAVFYSAGIEVPSSSSSQTTSNDFEDDLDDDDVLQEEEEDDDSNTNANDQDEAERQQNKDEQAKLHHGETLPMVVMDAHEYGAIKDGTANKNTSFSSLPTTTMPRRSTTSAWKRWSLHCLAVSQTHPTVWARRLYRVLVVQSFLIKVVLPLHCLALVMYYGAGNPEWEFLPTSAHSSWLLNFIARQFVTFDLARLAQWLLLDCLLLGSRTVAHFMGPIVTMTAVQSRGWRFVVVAWGCWDMLLLRGKSPFQSHWLSGVLHDWRFYTVANSGRYILESDDYRRILLSLIVAGSVTTAKRMFLTVHFGRRMLVDFKPSLEKILADIVLVNDIADLAVEASNLQDEIPAEMETTKSSSTKSLSKMSQSSNNVVPARSMPKRGLWTSVNFQKQEDMAGSQSEGDDDDDDDDDYVDEEEKKSNGEPHEINTGTNHGDRPHLARSSSGSVLFKKRLEKWEEPQTKIDKSGDIAIQDVLKFKHALNYMDDKHPFGESFGRIMDRNDAIDSAHIVYHQLLKCSPDSKVLPFEILSWITYDEKDVQNEAKLKALRRLFHPDARGNLTLFAFVQSCDMVYKRLRYFKASVRNASVIDNELEKILNYFYCFVLIMVLLAIMQINPWPLLVSMTSLLVSVSFALGSSVSKYVEGTMLIAVRRPFDLGDRILINSTDSVDTPGAPLGWFVEDITLSSTTLRFSKTNEVATVSNFAMSQLKIVNCQRSPNAIVLLTLKLHIKIFEGDKLKLFREALEKYVRQNPRIWEQIVTVRHDHIGGVSTSPQAWSPNNILDADYQFVIFTLCYQHRISWQSASRIMENRADLLRNIYEVCLELGVQYDNPAPRRMIVENTNNNFDPANAGMARSDPFGQTTVDPSKLF